MYGYFSCTIVSHVSPDCALYKLVQVFTIPDCVGEGPVAVVVVLVIVLVVRLLVVVVVG